jgi:hypothetical protein
VTESDLLAQEELNLRIRDALSEARRMAHDIEEMGSGSDALQRLHAALVTDPEVFYAEKMLIDQLQYLYGMTTSADQRPGADALQRIETLEAELSEITAQLQELRQ